MESLKVKLAFDWTANNAGVEGRMRLNGHLTDYFVRREHYTALWQVWCLDQLIHPGIGNLNQLDTLINRKGKGTS